MNPQLENIIQSLTETYDGMPWHGSSLKELLRGVNAEIAFFRPLKNNHNIAELIAHLLVWRQFTIEMLNHNYTFNVDIGALADFPQVAETEKVWRELQLLLDENQVELLAKLTQFNSAKLDDEIPRRNFTYRFLFEGIIRHDVYHGGQIGYLSAAFNSEKNVDEKIVKKISFI